MEECPVMVKKIGSGEINPARSSFLASPLPLAKPPNGLALLDVQDRCLPTYTEVDDDAAFAMTLSARIRVRFSANVPALVGQPELEMPAPRFCNRGARRYRLCAKSVPDG